MHQQGQALLHWGLAGDLTGVCCACLTAILLDFLPTETRVQSGEWMYLYTTVFTREHPALAPCGLGCGQGTHTDPLTWSIPETTKTDAASLFPSWQFLHQLRPSMECTSLSQPSLPVSHTLTKHSPPQAYSHCSAFLLNTVAEAPAPENHLSSCIKTHLDNKLSRARTMLIFDLLIQYYVLLTVRK